MLFCILIVLFWIPLRILFPVKIIGKKNLPKKGGYVLTCNHTSNWDPILMDVYLNKKFYFLAKVELFKSKFVGFFLKRLGAYPINRDKPEISAFKFALGKLKKGKQLFIFPEGTRNKNSDEVKLLDIKSGAVTFASKAQTVVVPLVLYNKARVFRKNYLIIGEPIQIEGVDPTRLSREELDKNTQRLSESMQKLRESVDEMLSKKKEKKNERRKAKN